MRGREKPRILCVSRSASQLESICSAVSHREYEVVSASTPEQAVAVCVSHSLAAVVLDSEFCTEMGWSAAQTFKIVKPDLPVVLVGHDHQQAPPNGVDAVAPSRSAIQHKLDELLKRR
jgi:DNA-binding NtrC family response regulator